MISSALSNEDANIKSFGKQELICLEKSILKFLKYLPSYSNSRGR
jgi:hypothetical protein